MDLKITRHRDRLMITSLSTKGDEWFVKKGWLAPYNISFNQESGEDVVKEAEAEGLEVK